MIVDVVRYCLVLMLDIMFETLIQLLCNVLEGDEEAIARGGLEDTTIGDPSTPTLSA